MEQELIRKLRQENALLNQRIDHDELTRLFNRGATERLINQQLAKSGGAILVADMDRFRDINDRFGHIVGDQLLQKAAELLGYLVSSRDILGRVGGDEFVMFLPGCTSEKEVEDRCKVIQRRFRQYHRGDGHGYPLSITIGTAISRAGDTYLSLFDRADQQLLRKKNDDALNKTPGKPGQSGIFRDIHQIRDELVEQAMRPGAYCQDYETFKCIYRFLERGMQRTDQQACVILITLVDDQGEFPPLQSREEQMDVLGELLQNSLRAGDVFTRYTSCQYLVLVTNVAEGLADAIAKRVCTEFEARFQRKDLLLHYCYPLSPAGGIRRTPPFIDQQP